MGYLLVSRRRGAGDAELVSPRLHRQRNRAFDALRAHLAGLPDAAAFLEENEVYIVEAGGNERVFAIVQPTPGPDRAALEEAAVVGEAGVAAETVAEEVEAEGGEMVEEAAEHEIEGDLSVAVPQTGEAGGEEVPAQAPAAEGAALGVADEGEALREVLAGAIDQPAWGEPAETAEEILAQPFPGVEPGQEAEIAPTDEGTAAGEAGADAWAAAEEWPGAEETAATWGAEGADEASGSAAGEEAPALEDVSPAPFETWPVGEEGPRETTPIEEAPSEGLAQTGEGGAAELVAAWEAAAWERAAELEPAPTEEAVSEEGPPEPPAGEEPGGEAPSAEQYGAMEAAPMTQDVVVEPGGPEAHGAPPTPEPPHAWAVPPSGEGEWGAPPPDAGSEPAWGWGAPQEPPGSAEEPPGSAEEPPGSAEEPPGSAEEPPGSAEEPPGDQGETATGFESPATDFATPPDLAESLGIEPEGEAKGYVPDSPLDLSVYTCDDCVFNDTCPKKGQDEPASCGSFEWRAGSK